MKVILFGATGMVGQGVLRECIRDPDVQTVLAVVRSAFPQENQKVRQIVHSDFTNFAAIEPDLGGYDACFFCLGISSTGMSEKDYHHITYDITLAVAKCLVRLNPGMTFIYVSGTGTDSSERGRSMWARVKGKTENALLRLPFKASYMFRPGYIQPLHGIQSKTKLYRVFYVISGPLFPVLKKLFPKQVTTTEQIGRAMIHVAKNGYAKSILENEDINRASEKS
jgi:uncharacterized protein YbjT (DUF2867 family)